MAGHPFYFDAKALGESLREVAIDVLKIESQSVTSRWFHSPREVDLFIWTDSRTRIIKQQMSFFGQIIEWNAAEGVKTGFVVEEEAIRPSHRIEASEIIQFDSSPQGEPVNMALEVLHWMSALSEAERQVLIDNFSSQAQPNLFHRYSAKLLRFLFK